MFIKMSCQKSASHTFDLLSLENVFLWVPHSRAGASRPPQMLHLFFITIRVDSRGVSCRLPYSVLQASFMQSLLPVFMCQNIVTVGWKSLMSFRLSGLLSIYVDGVFHWTHVCWASVNLNKVTLKIRCWITLSTALDVCQSVIHHSG